MRASSKSASSLSLPSSSKRTSLTVSAYCCGVPRSFWQGPEQRFEHQRLFFAVSDDKLEVNDARHQLLRFVIERARALKILAHTVAQTLGLADVDDLALGVLVQVTAGLRGQVLQLLLKRHS